MGFYWRNHRLSLVRPPVPVLTAEMGRGVLLLLFTIFTSLPAPGHGCKGRAVLTDSSGIISDGDNAYPSYARCEWLIDGKFVYKICWTLSPAPLKCSLYITEMHMELAIGILFYNVLEYI